MKSGLTKKQIRALPTLTEVVAVPPATTTDGFAPTAAPPDAWDTEELVERVVQRLQPALDAQIEKIIADTLQEQLKEIAPRMRQRVDSAVRKAVAQAVAGEFKLPATRSRSRAG